MIKSLNWCPLPISLDLGRPPRLLAAILLRSASVALGRLARRIAATERARPRALALADLEFYVEAGAPEGALYAVGKLVGYVSGVKRL